MSTSNRQDLTVETNVIDHNVIAELKAIGGTEALFRRVANHFVEKVPTRLAEIEGIAGSQDAGALANAAHALKSVVSSLGAKRAGKACETLELLARTGQAFEARDLVEIIVRETRAALVEVEKLRSAA
jgi:HPt (histidine-containing phosphotransfer) domain-containing protein